MSQKIQIVLRGEVILLLIFTTILGIPRLCEGYEVYGSINQIHRGSVNRTDEIKLSYNFSDFSGIGNSSDYLKIKIFSEIIVGQTERRYVLDKSAEHIPIMFTVRQQFDVTSWQLPVRLNNGTGFTIHSCNTLKKTLCFSPPFTRQDQFIQVVVFTRSHHNIKFELNVTAEYDFSIRDGQHYTAEVSPVSSQFYFYEFTNESNKDFALIRMNSNDSVCMKVSVQPPTCPVFKTNMEFTNTQSGFWETATEKAGIQVRRKDFPDGFFLVFIVQEDDSACLEYQGIVSNTDGNNPPSWSTALPSSLSLRQKNFTFELASHGDLPSYWAPVLFPLLFYFFLTAAVIVVFIIFHHRKYKIVQTAGSTTSSTELISKHDTSSSSTLTIGSGLELSTKRLQSPLKIFELVKSDITRLERKSKRYCWSVIIIAIFYCLPVIQLTWIYVRVMLRTGDQDLCYYNFLCSRPWGDVPVFNHVYSNVGYMILGIVFVIIVRIKETHLKQHNIHITDNNKDVSAPNLSSISSQLGADADGNGNGNTGNPVESARTDITSEDSQVSSKSRTRVGFGMLTYIEPTNMDTGTGMDSKLSWHEKLIPAIENSTNCGIFYHFGLFYAMGLALFMEGVMSAAYHICPTQINFQFDTAFMYIIVMLCIVKLYQFRHPVYMNANVIFISLALMAIWVFFGLWSNGSISVRILFTLFHFFCAFNCLIFQYYVGYLRVKKEVVTNLGEVYKYFFAKLKHAVTKRELSTFRRQTVVSRNGMLASYDFALSRHRAILPGLVIFFNVFVTIANFTALRNDNFATQVLAILIVNLAAYLMYYAIMKYFHNEYKRKMWIQSSFYATVSIALWIPAMIYFTSNLTYWDRSPASSRIHNEVCFIMDFYDYHDFWHFLSAGGMFASFMFLLTIDDDLIGSHKSEIPVF